MKNSANIRIKILSVCVVFCGVFLMTRLYYVQILHGEEFSLRADRQYVRPNHSLFNRGTIFFETKDGERIPAATLKTGYIVSINPSLLENPKDTYVAIESLIDVDKEDFFSKASKVDDPYEEIASRVNQETADAILDLQMTGLQVSKEKWRYYP